MSIVAYYIHVNDTQLNSLREEPELIWNMNGDLRFEGAVLFDIDKDYDILAWLASPKKRKEQVQQVASFRAIHREMDEGANYDKVEFSRVLAEELGKLGAAAEDTDAIPTDAVLEAIEGRGTEAQRDPKITFGLGSARRFHPDEVKNLSVALQAVDEADLQKHFDRNEMAKFEVGGVGWLEEQDSVLGDFLIPALQGLRAFYQEAAERRHHVLVVYQ